MFRRKFLMAAIVAGIATLAGPGTSQAAFLLKLDSTAGGSVTFDLDALTSGVGDSGGAGASLELFVLREDISERCDVSGICWPQVRWVYDLRAGQRDQSSGYPEWGIAGN